MKLKALAAAAGTVAALFTTAPAAVAAPARPAVTTAPAIIEYCKLTVDYFFYTEHMISKFHIYCNQRPAAIRVVVQIEWWNPAGGSRHNGGWEAAPSMGEGYAPRAMLFNRVSELPKPRGTKRYQLASKCQIGETMSVHVFGWSRAPADKGGVTTKVNIRFGDQVYC